MSRSRSAPRVPAEVQRAASVAVLLAVAAFGLRSAAHLPSAAHPGAAKATSHAVLTVFGIVEGIGVLACITLLVLISRRGRRKRKPEEDHHVPYQPQVPWWSKALAILMTLAVLAIPIVLLGVTALGHRHGQGASTAVTPAPGHRSPAGHLTGPVHAAAGSSWWLLAGMALAGLAALALALSAWRGSRHRREPEPDRPRPLADNLAAAATAATRALAEHDDPSTAIIACYAAMERTLADVGVAPTAADTPAEVLARASAGGLVRSAAAGELTGLFRRARYSDHAMSGTDRAAALGALAGIRADLGAGAGIRADLGAGAGAAITAGASR